MVLAAVLLALGTLFFTLFVRKGDLPVAPPPPPTEHLEQRKAQIYENLRDLQFEYRLGKLSDEDYGKTKLGLQSELARVLAEIDAVNQSMAPAAAAAAVGAAPKAPKKACPHCGAKFGKSMKFCGECGKAMA